MRLAFRCQCSCVRARAAALRRALFVDVWRFRERARNQQRRNGHVVRPKVDATHISAKGILYKRNLARVCTTAQTFPQRTHRSNDGLVFTSANGLTQQEALESPFPKLNGVGDAVRGKRGELPAEGGSEFMVPLEIAEGITRLQHGPTGVERLIQCRKRLGVITIKSGGWRDHRTPPRFCRRES